ncbi:MAG TPA: ABC transporter permease, partial [Thermoanaerobaculia bacterium]|nr:ABC transporter permease [Thermoanaerobaculia bacterium]
MGILTQELRLSFRKIWRNPFLSLVVILSLGLAIGAVTAVFSVVNAFLVRPLAIDDLERVVRVRENFAPPGEEPQLRSVSAANYYLWKELDEVFSGVAAGTFRHLTWTGAEEPERIQGAAVTASFFPMLGIEPVLGRTFRPDEDRPGAGGVVLLSHRVWTSRFGGGRDALGRSITLNGEPHTVIGVMPRGLHHPYEADMWVPLGMANDPTATWGYYVPARLAPGVTLERAQEALDREVALLRRDHPHEVPPWTAQLSPLREELVADLDELLWILLAAAGFVLLIACANVANLLLARSMGESVEVAIQTALGASQWRLFRQSLLFSVILALLGGAVGVLLTFWSVDPLVSLAPVYGLGEFDIEPRMDWVTLGFAVLVSCFVGVLFGIIPAMRTRRKRLQTDLREGGRGGGLGVRSRRALSGFVIAQIALAVALLMAAGLMYRSLQRMVSEDRGFDLANVLTFQVSFPESRYPGREERVEFVRRAVERLERLPGVSSAGATTTQPLYPGTWSMAFNVEGRPAENAQGVHVLHTRTVTPGYLETLRVPLLQGRLLDDRDDEDAPPVVVVSRSMAERYWPGQNPIGKRVKRGTYESENPW